MVEIRDQRDNFLCAIIYGLEDTFYILIHKGWANLGLESKLAIKRQRAVFF